MESEQNPLFSLKNKTAIVTGAGKGLGKHFSLTLAKAGAFVILIGRNQKLLVEVEKEIQALGGNAMSYCLDLSSFQDLEKHIETLFTQFKKVDILVNNAGITSKIKKDAFEYSELEWDEIFNLNVKAMWLLTNYVVKRMIARQIQGSIINISSMNGAKPRPTNTLYCLSKGTVEELTKNLALDYAKYHIRVNAIAPGVFGVGMSEKILKNADLFHDLVYSKVPFKRIGNLEELDGALLLLASNASTYMTGNCLSVDGGFAVS